VVGCVDVWWGVLQVLAHDQVAQRKREVKAAEEDLKRRMKAAKKDHIPFSDEQVRRWDMYTYVHAHAHIRHAQRLCTTHSSNPSPPPSKHIRTRAHMRTLL